MSRIVFAVCALGLLGCGPDISPEPPNYQLPSEDAGSTVVADAGTEDGGEPDAGFEDSGDDAGTDAGDQLCKNGYGWGDHNHCHHKKVTRR